MQKVVGSNPISRSYESPAPAGFWFARDLWLAAESDAMEGIWKGRLRFRPGVSGSSAPLDLPSPATLTKSSHHLRMSNNETSPK